MATVSSDAPVFRLDGISVVFDRYEGHRSLRHALDPLFGRGSRRPGLHALRDVSLVIGAGEHVGLIGRNGAGKSTLLRVLTRVLTPKSGRLEVDARRRMVPLLELGIGFHPDLSGRENCYLAGSLMGYGPAEIRARLPGIIAFAELAEFIDEPVKRYSSGMYARLAFALATDVEPEVLLVDEVFGVGDEFFMRKCIVRMQRLMVKGTTTVFVSHNLDFLVAQCDRLIWLDQGAIAMDGTPEAVAAEYRRLAGSAA
jgi:ABC-type polysaccharide/polyol phosphate transport system ATPase subunit